MQCEAPLLVALFCATNLQLMRGSCMASEEVQQGQVGSVVPLQLSMCWQQVACLTYFRGYLLGPSLAWRRCHFLAVCSKAWLLPHTHTHASVDLPGHRYACLCVCVCTSIKLSDHRKKNEVQEGNCRAAETTLLQLGHLQLVRLFCRKKRQREDRE